MPRIAINGVEVAINGEVVLIDGDDGGLGAGPLFYKETRMGVIPSWQSQRTPVPERQAPQGSAPSSWPRKNEETL